MEKRTLFYLVINLFLFLSLLAIAILSQSYFYNMELDNCNSILTSDYNVATDSVSYCYKLDNYPFWAFTLGHYLIYGGIHLFIAAIVNIIIFVIFDTTNFLDDYY
jgi:hypothetical protein